MHSRNTLAVSVLLFVLVAGEAVGQKDTSKITSRYWTAGSKEIWQSIDGILNDPNLTGANWGVVVQAVNSGEVLYKRNENKLMNSASLVKLITTAAALSYLGSDYTYETQIRTTGTIENDQLKGDLIVVGSGDPTISGKFTDREVYSVFNAWADRLLELGVTGVNGDLIGYDLLFDQAIPGEGWQWNHLVEWFSAAPSSLAFNDNSVDVFITPGAPGAAANIELSPDTRYITVLNDITTVNGDPVSDVQVSRVSGSNVIKLSGRINLRDKSITRSVSVYDPTEFFLQSLKEVFHRRGIRIKGRIKLASMMGDQITLDGTTLLFRHKSRPFSEIVKICNKNSHNFYAEQILKTMGLVDKGLGTVENGLRVENDWLERAGVSPNSLRIVDGSGLSLLNLTSAEIFAKLLRYLYRSDDFSVFYNSLPVAGRDGSMADRLLDGSAANNLRAKPGLNENVRSLAGYIKTADNETLTVVFIANNYLVPYSFIDTVIDKICNRLSILKRKK